MNAGKRIVQLFHVDGGLSYQLKLPAPPSVENALNHLRAISEGGVSLDGIRVVTLEVVSSVSAAEALERAARDERQTDPCPPLVEEGAAE